MSKLDFQDGGCGGRLGFPINIILAHFNPEIFLLLQCKFRLKSTKDYGRDVENWVTRPTETKYRDETDIPKRTIKNIRKESNLNLWHWFLVLYWYS